MAVSNKKRKEPIIYDATLREGFQSPGGIGATLDERVYIASLTQNYAHWVELGMPANNVDFEIISAIRDRFLEEGYAVGIGVLARCNSKDIERAAEVMRDYPNSLIHLFIGTSDQHRANRFDGKKDPIDYENLIRNHVRNAASKPEFSHVKFSPEDSYRTFIQSPENLIKFISAAKEGYDEGNKKIGREVPIIFNLPDTVGASTILEFGREIELVKKEFGNTVDISVHCHNDNFMSNAQAIDVYQRYNVNLLETTFGQLGERNGIGSTDSILKILVERGYLTDKRIISEENLMQLDPTTKAILWTLGREVPDEHLDRMMVSTAGIHTALTQKDSNTYHIRGEEYGSKPYIELGPTSGSTQVIEILDSSGVKYGMNRIEEFTDKLKKESNKRKSPLSETHILYEAEIFFHGRDIDDGLKVEKYDVHTTSNGKTRLSMSGYIGGQRFDRFKDSNGPVEATMELLNELMNEHGGIDEDIALESYKPRIIPQIGQEYLHWEKGTRPRIPDKVGRDAKQAISLTFRNGSGNIYHGWYCHQNSTVAEVGAVIDGMEKMYALKNWNRK